MAEEEQEGEEQGGSKKKLMIIIIAAVAVLLLGGVAAYLLMGGEEEPPAEDAAKQEETKKEASDVDEEGNPLPALYFELKPAFLANLPPGGSHKLLQISLQVMSRQQGMIDFLDQNQPMVKHHLLNLFSAQNGDELKTRAGKEKLQAEVKEKIQGLAEEMDAEGKVYNAYFTKLVLE